MASYSTTQRRTGDGKDRKYARLVNAMRWSRKAMESFRRKRQQVIRIMYGAHWSDGSFLVSQPVNMLELTVRVWTRNLAAKEPTVTVTAKDRSLKPVAADFELVMRKVVREIDLGAALADAVFDALTCPVGTIKCGITEKELGEQAGWSHDAGQPFADAVDFDDLVLDMSAARFESMVYSGDRYSLPYEAAMDSRMFRKGGMVPRGPGDLIRDEQGNVNALAMAIESVGAAADERDAIDMIDLWDVWEPRSRTICTFACDPSGLPREDDPVRVVEWTGPERGPYHFLSYGKGKGLMRAPPISALRDLNDAINKNFRKLNQQSGRQKTILAVQGGAEQDGERVVQSSDGDSIRVDRTDGVKEMRFGGADPGNLAYSLQLRDIYSYMAGNLDSQGGLSQTAGTLGQEELIHESSSQTIEDMRTTTVIYAKRVVESVAANVWYDPERVYMVEKPLGKSGITLPVEVRPEDREEADFVEMNFDIMPSSMMDTSSGQRLRSLMSSVSNLAVPLAPAIQAQGAMIDTVSLFRNIAEMSNTPEIADLVVAGPSPQESPSGGAPQDESRMPTATRREYVRKSVPSGGTRSARDAVMSQALMGNVTPQQQAMMGRTG